MNKSSKIKKEIRLSPIDRKTLLANSNILTETGFKPILETATGKNTIKLT